jgi:hypothetical protein
MLNSRQFTVEHAREHHWIFRAHRFFVVSNTLTDFDATGGDGCDIAKSLSNLDISPIV